MLEYKVVKVVAWWEQQDFLNEQADQGWRLVAVSDEVLYLERMVSVELSVQTDAELFTYVTNGSHTQMVSKAA